MAAVGNIEEYSEKLSKKFPYIMVNVNERTFEITYTVNAPVLARYMREHDRFIVLDGNGNKTLLLWYENGVYKTVNENGFKGKIKKHISDFNESDIKLNCSRVYDEVFKELLVTTPTTAAVKINEQELFINFQDGLLNTQTMQFVPHSPEILSTVQLPCKWNTESGNCPVFDTYLETLTSGDRDVERLLWEYMGLVLSNIHGYRIKSALFLTGAADTGKSKFIELLGELLGSSNYANIDLGKIEQRFGTFQLWGKRLGGAGDMSILRISELKNFKELTGGDHISYEGKCLNAFTAPFYGCLCFGCNEMPRFGGDRGEHVYRRMLLVNCQNVIPKEKQDPKIVEKFLTERTAIVHKAIAALRNFIERGYKFIIPEQCKSNRTQYALNNSTVLQFLSECTCPRDEADHKLITSTGQMYKAYKNYTLFNGGSPVSNQVFKREIKEVYKNDLEHKDRRGNRFYCFELTASMRGELLAYENITQY